MARTRQASEPRGFVKLGLGQVLDLAEERPGCARLDRLPIGPQVTNLPHTLWKSLHFRA